MNKVDTWKKQLVQGWALFHASPRGRFYCGNEMTCTGVKAYSDHIYLTWRKLFTILFWFIKQAWSILNVELVVCQNWHSRSLGILVPLQHEAQYKSIVPHDAWLLLVDLARKNVKHIYLLERSVHSIGHRLDTVEYLEGTIDWSVYVHLSCIYRSQFLTYEPSFLC